MTSTVNSIPLLCFGVGAFLAPKLERSLGMRALVFWLTFLITVSIGVRGWGGEELFLLGTLVLSISVALANVLLPTLVRILFPDRIGLATGFYVTVMAVSASVSAASAVPLAELVGSWQVALSIWATPGLLALVTWILVRSEIVSRSAKQPEEDAVARSLNRENPGGTSVYRQSTSWLMVAFFALQSLGFYAVLGWLAPALVSAGMQESSAGVVLALATGLGIPLGLITSTRLHRVRSISKLNLASSASALGGLILFAIIIQVGFPNLVHSVQSLLLATAIALLSLGQAVTFPIALALISMKASTPQQTTQLSAMTQGIGYCVAFIGSFALGYLGSEFGFGLAFGLLALLTVAQLWLSWLVARPTQLQR